MPFPTRTVNPSIGLSLSKQTPKSLHINYAQLDKIESEAEQTGLRSARPFPFPTSLKTHIPETLCPKYLESILCRRMPSATSTKQRLTEIREGEGVPLDPHAKRQRSLGFAACALASMFWGCGFFFGKIALAEMNSGAMVLYRFLFAALGLLPFLLSHRPELNRREWMVLLIASVLGVPLQFLFQFHGLALTTVSHAALMVGTMPVILAVGATLFAHERLHIVGWIALAVSTTGAALIALGGTEHASANDPTLRGDLWVVLSLCIALFWVLLNQRLVTRHNPIVITAYGLCAGTVMLLLCVPPIYGLPPVHGVSLKAWLALAASGLLCTATTTLLWNWGMTRVPASQAGVMLNMEPLIGSLLGVFVLHDRLGPLAWLGGAMILIAAITLTTRRHPSEAIVTFE